MAGEKNFENRVKKFLKDSGCYFIKYWGGGEFTKSGVPDIICCCNGIFLGIEIKGEKGKPSPLQIHNLKQIDEAGGVGLLLYPKDFADFKYMMLLMLKNDDLWVHEYNRLQERWLEKVNKK